MATPEHVRNFWTTRQSKTEARRIMDGLNETVYRDIKNFPEAKRVPGLEKERQGPIKYGPATK